MDANDNHGPPQRLTLTVEEAGQMLGVSRSYAYELVRQGALPCIRLGRIVIPMRALDALIDRVVAEATVEGGTRAPVPRRSVRSWVSDSFSDRAVALLCGLR